MKGLKIFSILIVFLLILVIAVGYYVFKNINQIVKSAVETYGPPITQTSVKLEGVDIGLTEGKGELTNFIIGNPKGFSSEHSFKLGKLVLQIDTGSITENVKVIKNIDIQGVNIKAEQKGKTTNLQTILNTLSKGGSGESAASESDESSSSNIRLMVERIHFADSSIDLVTEKLGNYSVDMPSFELKNLGDKNTGLTPEELGQAILEPLVKKAKKAAEKRLEELATAELKELEGKAKEKAEERLKEEEGKLEKDLEEEIGKDNTEKLKGLKDLL